MDLRILSIFDDLPVYLRIRNRQMLTDETVRQISEDYDTVLTTMRGMKRLVIDESDSRYKALDQLRCELQEELVDLLLQR